jgi:hypothetical protein
MGSPWQVPLPLEEYTALRVAAYFYKGRWIPIMSLRLADAIKLHRQALSLGRDIVVFPPDLDPNTVILTNYPDSLDSPLDQPLPPTELTFVIGSLSLPISLASVCLEPR